MKSERRELVYVSLGAGVQSSALLVMSALGLRGCPKADYAVFADTQDEPRWVYEHLDVLTAWGAEHGLPVRVVSRGRLSEHVTVSIPAFVQGKDRAAPLSRNCTRDYKLVPIHQLARVEMRLTGAVHAVSLMGISIDEAHRQKDSRRPWLTHAYPLIDAGMTRSGCAALLEAHGLPVPRKSACVYCPWHSDDAWTELREHDPAGWQSAVAFDARLRATRSAFLHRSLIPLADVSFSERAASLFGNDCEGVCGV